MMCPSASLIAMSRQLQQLACCGLNPSALLNSGTNLLAAVSALCPLSVVGENVSYMISGVTGNIASIAESCSPCGLICGLGSQGVVSGSALVASLCGAYSPGLFAQGMLGRVCSTVGVITTAPSSIINTILNTVCGMPAFVCGTIQSGISSCFGLKDLVNSLIHALGLQCLLGMPSLPPI
jgi:hypothetical protein